MANIWSGWGISKWCAGALLHTHVFSQFFRYTSVQDYFCPFWNFSTDTCYACNCGKRAKRAWETWDLLHWFRRKSWAPALHFLATLKDSYFLEESWVGSSESSPLPAHFSSELFHCVSATVENKCGCVLQQKCQNITVLILCFSDLCCVLNYNSLALVDVIFYLQFPQQSNF